MPGRENEWSELYQALLVFFSRVGENDPFGEKDYWVVDDNWGQHQHKICIHNPAIMNSTLVGDLQNLLRSAAPTWSCMLDLDLPNCPGGGITVGATGVQYDWDLVALRSCLNMPHFFR